MLFNLVLKDFILARKYFIFIIIIAIAIPIYITASKASNNGGFLGFFITVLYLEHFLFGTVSVAEEKYKGSTLLCTTPYTRNTLVKAKYISGLVTFVYAYIIYTITAFVVPMGIEKLNIFAFGSSLQIITIIWGFMIPTQYKFGYEKTKYLSIIFIFISIFAVPNILKWLNSNAFSYQVAMPQIIQNFLPYVVALSIGFSSMIISTKIYSKKNL